MTNDKLEKLSGEVSDIRESVEATKKKLEDETKMIKKDIEILQKDLNRIEKDFIDPEDIKNKLTEQEGRSRKQKPSY